MESRQDAESTPSILEKPMDGKDRSENKELTTLHRSLTRMRHKSGLVPFCGYGGDSNSHEKILWKYIHRAMEPEEMEAFESHRETCSYCLKRLNQVLKNLETVEKQEGYSREKVRAMLADRERKQEQALDKRVGSRLRRFFEGSFLFVHPVRTTLAGAMAALLVIFVALYVFLGRGPTPLGELVAGISLQSLPADVKAGIVSESVSELLLPNGVETSTALLPDTSVPESAYFLSLGIVFQSLQTLVQFSPLEGDLRTQADAFSDYMETLLKTVDRQGALPKQADLFRERMMSNLYGPERLQDFLAGIKKDVRRLAGTGKLEKQKATEALDLGLWLALLNRTLNLQAMGYGMEQSLSILLRSEYVDELKGYGSRYFHSISFDEMRPALAALEDAAGQLKSGGLSTKATEAALRAVGDIVHSSFLWSLSA